MKKSVVLGMSGICLAFILVFSGCVGVGGAKDGAVAEGILTIIGIPAEYEGGTVEGAAGPVTISNGSVSIEVRQSALQPVSFTIADSLTTTRVFVVRFENQAATVNWADGVSQ
jgi:hypothetical protein